MCAECVCAAPLPAATANRGPAGRQDPGQRHPGRPAPGEDLHHYQDPAGSEPIRAGNRPEIGLMSDSVMKLEACWLSDVCLPLQSKSSLEMMESQSCDAEPPPPPKPELRYPGMSRGNTEGKHTPAPRLHTPGFSPENLPNVSILSLPRPQSAACSIKPRPPQPCINTGPPTAPARTTQRSLMHTPIR